MANKCTSLPQNTLTRESQQFYEEIYRQYNSVITGFFRRHGYTQDEALDELQNVYFRVIRQNQPEKLVDTPKAYLLSVATNLVRDRYRREHRQNQQAREDVDLDNLPTLEASPENTLQLAQQMLLMKQALMELPEKKRKVFLMKRLEGMTCKAISDKLNIPLRTVERYLSEAFVYCQVRAIKETGVKN
ncbi:RNA polymerase sigma factor [Pseudomaricurvus alkylphenolicus]|jgi:RNA polymerase sigma-70 factor (ECF subfamily)|uniref:RNA polymerase sigma factor n=1 Tax=Pseudomaricurvus alkylphenolicus TaxID=1306991 RepID=UPI00142152DA|nr:RNA polymerase sigma factor [Pseudomaricurvus alkylphenolicus]NIB38643.1 RNA polymerase sigma factor [Pseudomaricurvus alkylphenolicus]